MIKIRPLCCIKVVPDPTPVAAYDYRIDLYSNQPTLYVNTVCFNRSEEGTGNCYSDPACTNELYDLEAWNSGTPDTELTGVYDDTYYVCSIYLKNVNVPPQGYYGTIIAANDSSVNWQWVGGYVYDSNNQIISQWITGPDYPGHWVDVYYTPQGTSTCSVCGGTGLVNETCSRCGGSGQDPEYGHEETCPDCGGTGEDQSGGYEETCSECGGSGMVDYGEGDETCIGCGGTGTVWNTACITCCGGGTTWVADTCTECGGTGETQTTCNTCGGDGVIGD